MAKTMRMEPLPHCNKITARQPADKPVLIGKRFKSNNSLKKQTIIKEAYYMIPNRVIIRCKIMAGETNKSLIATRQKAPPASARLIGLLGPFFDCATVQGLNFSGFVVVIGGLAVASLLLRLLENLKLWKRLQMHQYKARKLIKRRSKGVGGKWTWMEDLLSGLDVSGIDDLFISICILMGLGFLFGLLVLVRRFNSKNLEE